jgi:hypothetical protein
VILGGAKMVRSFEEDVAQAVEMAEKIMQAEAMQYELAMAAFVRPSKAADEAKLKDLATSSLTALRDAIIRALLDTQLATAMRIKNDMDEWIKEEKDGPNSS